MLVICVCVCVCVDMCVYVDLMYVCVSGVCVYLITKCAIVVVDDVFVYMLTVLMFMC